MFLVNSAFNLLLLCFLILADDSFSENNQSKSISINRFELSYNSLLFTNSNLSDSSSNIWFSQLNNNPNNNSALNLHTKDQSLSLDLKMLLAFEHITTSNRFFALTSNVSYHSPYLNAFISADVYTTEDRIPHQDQDIQYERFIKKDFNKPMEGVFDFRVNLPEAYLQSQFKFFKLTIGKQKKRWGPGYKGTLGLSGTAYSPVYFYDLNLNFGQILQMTAFLNGFDDESIYRSELQFDDSLTIKSTGRNIKTNFPRFGAGQRIDLRIGKHIQIGIYELADLFGSNELVRFVNPLQIYYLSNESSGTNNANLLGGIDFNLIFKRFRFYGEFLNDDITIFEDKGNPNKYAFQLGGTFYGRSPLIQTGIEYTHVSPYVYGHSRVLSRHAHWGESMGWPWGNDQDLLNIHAVFAFPHNIKGRAELNYWLKGDGTINDDWYADGKPNLDHAPYWPQNSRKILSAIIAAEYSPLPWITISTYYEPVIENRKLENGVYCYLQVGIPGNRFFQVK